MIRVIRHASTFHIFTIDEDSKQVSHTAPSRAFLSKSSSSDTHPDIPAYTLQDTLNICLDLRFLNTAFQIGDALRQNKDIVEPNRTAFNMAFNTGLNYLEYMVDPENSALCETMLRHLTFVLSGHNMVTSHHDQDILANSISSSTNNDEPDIPIPNEGKIVDVSRIHTQLILLAPYKHHWGDPILHVSPLCVSYEVTANNIYFFPHNLDGRWLGTCMCQHCQGTPSFDIRSKGPSSYGQGWEKNDFRNSGKRRKHNYTHHL